MGNSGISTKQKVAVRSLLSGATYIEAAKAANVHENTIALWMKDPKFKGALKEAENDAMAVICRSLLGLTEKATAALDAVLENPKARDSSRLRAADIALGRMVQIRELSELQDRIKALEEKLNEQK